MLINWERKKEKPVEIVNGLIVIDLLPQEYEREREGERVADRKREGD